MKFKSFLFHEIQIYFFKPHLNLIFLFHSNLIFSWKSNLIFFFPIEFKSYFFISFKSYFSMKFRILFFSNKIHFLNHFWNSIWKFNSTPLIIASSKGYTEIARLLLSHKNIEINSKDISIQRHSWYSKKIFFIIF